jgi:hypothetical protein
VRFLARSAFAIALFAAVVSGSLSALNAYAGPKLDLVAFDDTTTTTSAPPTTVAPTTTTAAPTTTTAAPTTTTAPPPPPPPAPAPAVQAAAAPSDPQAKGEAALARLNYPWQKLGFSVRFEGNNSGLLGKANCGTKEITVYVRSSQSVTDVAFVTAFELGHAIDCGTMDDARRAEWAAIRGFPAGWTWFPGCLCTEDNFGSGDISMVFGKWLVPESNFPWRSKLAGPPSAEQLERLMPYLRPAGVA